MSNFNAFDPQELQKGLKDLEKLSKKLSANSGIINKTAKGILLRTSSALLSYYGSLVKRPLKFLPDNADSALVSELKLKGKPLSTANGQPLVTVFKASSDGLTIEGEIEAVRSVNIKDACLKSYKEIYKGFGDYSMQLSYAFTTKYYRGLTVNLETVLDKAFVIKKRNGGDVVTKFVKQSNPDKYFGNERTRRLYGKTYRTKTGKINVVLPAIVNIRSVYEKGAEKFQKNYLQYYLKKPAKAYFLDLLEKAGDD